MLYSILHLHYRFYCSCGVNICVYAYLHRYEIYRTVAMATDTGMRALAGHCH